MVFTSLQFVLFGLVVYGLYRVLPHRAQNVMLLLASYYFYAAWDWRYLGLLLGTTVVDYSVGLYLGPNRPAAHRRAALVLSLVFNFGVLAIFKYFNFFAESIAALAARVGWRVDPITLYVLLPVGISFYTFMTVSYVIDVYRRDIEPTRHPLDFALFVAYFPHLVAGPILRASLLLPQIERPRTLTRAQSQEGLWLIAWGAFQKMFLADNLAPLVESVYGAGASPGAVDVLLGTYAFALQIYGDFAGYSNIARGVSKLFGIELNVNFLFPYFVTSPQKFWQNWHISLSTWLRDYLYIPLGGSRQTAPKTYRNLMITMLLGGLWHGAAWTFVLWGAYQGVVLVVARVLERPFGPLVPAAGPSWRRMALAVLMFHVTCYGWLMFRAESVGQIWDFTRAILTTDLAVTAATWEALVMPLVLIAAPFFLLHVFQAGRGTELAPMTLPLAGRYAVYAGVVLLVLVFGDFGGTTFIYFQF